MLHYINISFRSESIFHFNYCVYIHRIRSQVASNKKGEKDRQTDARQRY